MAMGQDTPQPPVDRATTSPAGEPGPSSGDAQSMKRTGGALSKFTRSISKLGTRAHRRAASELPPASRLEERASHPPFVAALSEDLTRAAGAQAAGQAGARSSSPHKALALSAQQPPGQDFIRCLPGVLALEGEVSAISSELRSAEATAVAVRGAAAPEDPGSTSAGPPPPPPSPWAAPAQANTWRHHLDACDAAVAEHRMEAALGQLRTLEDLGEQAARHAAAAGRSDRPAAAQATAQELVWRLQGELESRRDRLAAALEVHIAAPSLEGAGVRAAVEQLAAAAGPARALAALLQAASASLRRSQQAVTTPFGSTAEAAQAAAVAFAAAIGQGLAEGVLCAVATASEALGATTSPDLSAALLAWSQHEVRATCAIVRHKALLSCAVPAGLRATAQCMAALLAYCEAMGGGLGAAAEACAHRELWPTLHQALTRRVGQLVDGVRKAAQAEAGVAIKSSAALPPAEGALWPVLAGVFPSADRMLAEVGALAQALAAVGSPKATAALRGAVTEVFAAYTASLAAALQAAAVPGPMEVRARGVAEVALVLCTCLAEGSLREVAAPVAAAGWGPVCDTPLLLAHLELLAHAVGIDAGEAAPPAAELVVQA